MASAKTTGKTAPRGRKTATDPNSKLTTRGAEIIADLKELCETVEAGIPIHQKFRVTYYTFDFKTPEYGPADVKRVRQGLSMSQGNFAAFLGVDASTVQSWEQGTRNPSGPAKRLMQEVEADPKYWGKRIMAAAKATTVGPKPKG
jgi:putative transcriptional regulator